MHGDGVVPMVVVVAMVIMLVVVALLLVMVVHGMCDGGMCFDHYHDQCGARSGLHQ